MGAAVLSACGGAAAPAPSATPGQAGGIRAISTPDTPAHAASPPAAGSPLGSAQAAASAVSGPGAAAATPAGAVRLGLMGPFSGAAASFGQEMLKAAQMAIDEANAGGGLNGRRLTLDQGDDKADPSGAPAVAQKLVADGAPAAVGPATSGSALAAAPAFNQANVPMITPTASDPRITEQGLPFVFRATGRWDQEPPLIAARLRSQAATAKVALVSDKSAYGQLLAAGMRQALSSAGVAPVAEESVEGEAKDFEPVVAKVKAQGAGSVFYGGYAPEGAALAKALRAAGWQGQIAMGDAAEDQALITAGGQAVEGLLLAYALDPRQTGAASFLDGFKRRYGTAASLYAVSTYDAVRLALDALRRADKVDGEAVRRALAERDFPGVYWGRMRFDAKGDLQATTYALWQVRGGRFQQLG